MPIVGDITENVFRQKSVLARLRPSKLSPDFFQDAGSFIHFMRVIKSLFVSTTVGQAARAVDVLITVAHDSNKDCRRNVRRSLRIAPPFAVDQDTLPGINKPCDGLAAITLSIGNPRRR